MRVDGLDEQGVLRLSAALTHGGDPDLVVWEHGFSTVRPLDASRNGRGELVLRLLVRPAAGGPAPLVQSRGRDRALSVPDVVPEVRQRLAAYAVVRSARGLLATQYSARTAVNGRWGMPGGGLDENEQPVDAVLREVWEETSQIVILGELVKVQTSHWLGRSPRDTIEDFHAVRLIYRAECLEPSDPVVLDAGGTTESARWVSTDHWANLRWTQNWRLVLGDLLAAP